MSWIVMIDIRENNGHFLILEDEDGNTAQFYSQEEAKEAARNHFLSDGYPCHLVCVDEDTIETI